MLGRTRWQRQNSLDDHRSRPTFRTGFWAIFIIAGWIAYLVYGEVNDCGGLCVRQEQGIIHVGNVHPVGGMGFILLSGIDAFVQRQPVLLQLDSGGGDIATAWLMATWVRFLTDHVRVAALVKANDRCGSACTIPWASVPERYAEPNAVFFFHAARWAIFQDSAWRFRGLGYATSMLRRAVSDRDPKLAAYLAAKDAFGGAGRDVTLLGSEIAALGGSYLRLVDPRRFDLARCPAAACMTNALSPDAGSSSIIRR